MMATETVDGKIWSVPSSREEGLSYVVRQRRNAGYLTCNCKGFLYRKICSHVVAVEKTLPGGRQHAFLLAAIKFHDLGYHVIPVQAGGKCPLVAWKDFQTVRPSKTQICDWWRQWPQANVGLVLGEGRLVVDLDGGDEAEALLTAADITLPVHAPRVKTRSGYHVYLQAPTKQPDRIGLFKAAAPLAETSLTPKGKERVAQVDVRGLGIIIAPPSVHPSGHVYEWLTPLEAELPLAPESLLAKINEEPAKPVKPSCGTPGCDRPVGYRMVKDAAGVRRREYLPLCYQCEQKGEVTA